MDELILVVEDSQTQALVLENVLHRNNFQVAIASDGKEALDWLALNSVSLVLSDVMMPNLNGYELCRKIKEQKHTRHIPVILLTTLHGTDEIIEGLMAGADSFITKPYDNEYLISCIRKILSEKPNEKPVLKSTGVKIVFDGKKLNIKTNQQQTIKLLLNIYEGAINQNTRLLQSQKQLVSLNETLESMVAERTFALSEEIKLSKQIAEKLKESEQSLQYVLLGSQLGYWDWNLETNEVKRNNIWAEMLGYNLEEIEFTVNQWIDLIHPEDQAKAMKSIQDHLEGLTPMIRGEYRMRTKDGQYMWILDQAQAVKWNSEGKAIRISGTHTDITDRKLAEEEIKLKNEALNKVNAEKDKFFSIVAHDLRGPLSSFLGLTKMMVEELPSMEQADLHNMAITMEKSATNVFHLLENLLEWARMQRGLIPFNPEDVQLSSYVNESMEMLMETIKNKGIEITCNIPDDIRAVADTNMLQTIIRNLVSNAVKFTAKGGKINLTAKATVNNSLEISIKDSGIGMSPAMVENLFDLSNQNNRQGTEGEPSAGLGLLLCKEFVEKLGGKIWVESEEGNPSAGKAGGTEFHFTLPGPVEKVEKIMAPGIDLVDELVNQVNSKAPGLKILIAEDDADSEMLISLTLKRFCKEVFKARNGAEAVETCLDHPDIDLVMMDIRMPEMDGYEAMRQIRLFNSDLVIVAQTAFAVSEHREMALKAGCNEYILKPINKAELEGLIQKYFTNSEQWHPEISTQ